MAIYHLYTDGACQPNPGRGGWAAILKSDQIKSVIFGDADKTTNNRMELQAVIEGLNLVIRSIGPDNELVLFSDSKYVVNGMTTWMNSWSNNGWRKKNGDSVLNDDLWKQIASIKGVLRLKCVHIRGHQGNELNELADKVANAVIISRQKAESLKTQLLGH